MTGIKSILSIAVFVILYVIPSNASEYKEEDVSSMLRDWETAISQVTDKYDSDNLDMLGEAVRKLSRKRSAFPEWRIRLYLLAREKAISIPGHAKYFTDQLAEARSKTEKPWLDSKYEWVHMQTINTLSHLPSPETIWALGTILDSGQDKWTREELVEILMEQRKHDMLGSPTGESVRIAGTVFTNIGLRDYGDAQNSMLKEETFAWWHEVKSGQRSFSFKGQAVEYRFRPDGTWDTIPIANPPDDGIQMPAIANQKQDTKAASQESNKRSLPWLVIVAVCGSAVLFCLLLWKRKSRA